MPTRYEIKSLSANEAAYITGVPLKQVNRIIDARLLGNAVKRRKGARTIVRGEAALVGVKLAYETTRLLTPKGRKGMIRCLLERPDANIIRAEIVSVDIRPMKRVVRKGLTALEKAKKTVATNDDILDGTPCFKGTRIPVHDIADMVANGDAIPDLLEAYPALTKEKIESATIYASAYPRRGRPRKVSGWEKKKLLSSTKINLHELPDIP